MPIDEKLSDEQINPPSYPESVTSNASKYGFKTSNLIYLRDNILNGKSAENVNHTGTTVTSNTREVIKVPSFIPIDNTEIVKHLDTYAGDWRDLWNEFHVLQGNSADAIRKEAERVLSTLEVMIKDAFIKNRFQVRAEALDGKLLMIRSTGNEDRVDVANPGGNESKVSENEATEISRNIGEVIASYFSHKSMSQRLESGEDIVSNPPLSACLIQSFVGEIESASETSSKRQKLPFPPVSGVIYTENGRVRIQAAPGHGDLVVGSKGNFDNYYVTQNDSVYSEVRDKKFRFVPKINRATHKIELTKENNNFTISTNSSLDEKTVLKLSSVARQIESAYKMRMDIEFVYDPNTDEINIVQARAIPVGDRKFLIPSILDREYVGRHLEKIAQVKGTTITPDIMTAQIITDPSEILICTTIEEALNKYNSSAEKNIKAVIIEKDAPDTSHPAGMFTSKAIPVIQVTNIDEVRSWVQKMTKKDALIIDPQYSSVFKIPREDLSKEQNPIKKGVFRSPLTLHTTPEKFSLTEERIRATTHELKDTLNNVTTTKEEPDKLVSVIVSPEAEKSHGIKTIEKNLDILSMPVTGNRNEKQKIALITLLKLASNARKANLITQTTFTKIGQTASELTYFLNKLSSKESQREDLRGYLDVLKKLEGLYISKNKDEVISSSLIREIAKVKQEEKLETKYNTPVNLTEEQKEYYKELIKLEYCIADQSRRVEWVNFCKSICGNNGQGKYLAGLVSNLTQLGLHQYWVNTHFLEESKTTNVPNKILIHLFEGYNNQETQRAKLMEAIKSIDELEHEILNFKSPTKFQAQFRKLQHVVEAIYPLLIDPNHEDMDLFLATKSSTRLVDLFDKSIKTLQTSDEYTKEQNTQRIENFRTMISGFIKVLEKTTVNKSESTKMEYQKLAECIVMLTNNDPKQLDISPDFNVLCSNLYGVNSQRCDTLADVHSSIHQSLISYEAQRVKSLNDKIVSNISPEIQGVLQKVMGAFGKALTPKNPDLLSINFATPVVQLDYNIPLGEHSSSMSIKYDTNTKKIRIALLFFGSGWPNERTRWIGIANKFLAEFVSTNAKVTKCEAVKASGAYEVEIDEQDLEQSLTIFKHLTDLTFAYGYHDDTNKYIQELLQKTSYGFSQRCNQAENSVVFGSDARKTFLNNAERQTLSEEIDNLTSLSNEQKRIMKSYDGLGLFKNKILTEDIVKHIDPKIFPDILRTIVDMIDLINAEKITVADISKIDDREKLYSLSDNTAQACYKANIPFRNLEMLYDRYSSKNADDDFSQFERLLEDGVEKVKEAIKSLHQDEPVQAENLTMQSIKDQMKQFHDSENVTPKNSGYKK